MVVDVQEECRFSLKEMQVGICMMMLVNDNSWYTAKLHIDRVRKRDRFPGDMAGSIRHSGRETANI